MFRQQCYVGGAWVNAENGGTFAVTNPADGSQIGTVPSFSAADTQRAIDAARGGFAGLASQNCQGEIADSAPLVRPMHAESG